MFSIEITLGEILTIFSVLVAAIGLFLTFLQMRRADRQKRAEFVINMCNQYLSDSDMMSIHYEIEYDTFEYTENFHQSPKEKQLDKLLLFFDNIAKLWQMRGITLKDVQIVAYHYLMVYQNKGVKEYLKFLDKWFKRRGVKFAQYAAFRELGKKLEESYFQES